MNRLHPDNAASHDEPKSGMHRVTFWFSEGKLRSRASERQPGEAFDHFKDRHERELRAGLEEHKPATGNGVAREDLNGHGV